MKLQLPRRKQSPLSCLRRLSSASLACFNSKALQILLVMSGHFTSYTPLQYPLRHRQW